MLTPIGSNDVQLIQQEMNRQYKLGSMFMDREDYDYFSTLMSIISDLSDDGLYSMGLHDNSDERLFELVHLLRDVEEFEILNCQKYYLEPNLSLNSSVEEILEFVSSLSAVAGKRYAVFTNAYPSVIDEKQQNWNGNIFPNGYPRYGFTVVIFGDENNPLPL